MLASNDILLTQRTDTVPLVIPKLWSPVVKNRWELRVLRLRVLWEWLRVGRERHHGFRHAFHELGLMRRKYEKVFGERFISKAIKVGGRYFWRMGGPGFPSEASSRMYCNEIDRQFSLQSHHGQRTIIMAITKRCPLNCEHCSEWHNLGTKEAVSVDEWTEVVRTFQRYGTTQIMFSGGEPMVRVKDIYQLLDRVDTTTEFWIITSGVGLRAKQARELKAHGLTGVMVSVDHHEEAAHDQFRGRRGTFRAAVAALVEAKKAGLVTAMSLCATRAFTTAENLKAYMDLARRLGVGFVRFLEPRPVGRYAGSDVLLAPSQLSLLEEFYHQYNGHPNYRDFPIIDYMGYHQRRVGCFGAANRFFYIDTEGDAHISPFCVGKVVSTLNRSAEDIVDTLREHRCPAFAMAEV